MHLFSPQVYLKYDFERTVEPVAKINTVPFGKTLPAPFRRPKLGTDWVPRHEVRTGVLVSRSRARHIFTHASSHQWVGHGGQRLSALNAGACRDGRRARGQQHLRVIVWLCHTVRAYVSDTEHTHIWAALFLVHT